MIDYIGNKVLKMIKICIEDNQEEECTAFQIALESIALQKGESWSVFFTTLERVGIKERKSS
jgi:hypothetical protein